MDRTITCTKRRPPAGGPAPFGVRAGHDLPWLDTRVTAHPQSPCVGCARHHARHQGGAMQVRRVTAGIAAATAAVTLAACTGGAGTVSSANATAVISIGIAEPTHLIPTNTTDSSGAQVLTALFTPLVTFDKGGKPVPDQAASITTTDISD